MDLTKESCRTFTEILASPAPAPGGGGAAALVGALGVALGHMAANLTLGKKKYAAVQQRMEEICDACTRLENTLLDQVEADELGFLPLAAIYRLPKDAPDRDRLMDEASLAACQTPLRVMELCAQALDCIALVAQHGSRLAVSDTGAGAVCCKAAMQSAALAIFCNTKTLHDRAAAEAVDQKVNTILAQSGAVADGIFRSVCAQLGQEDGHAVIG